MRRDRLRWLTARPIAHRGLHDIERGRPENTLAAFEAAIANHYAIECDVHLSADAVPVVVHDFELTRLTGESSTVSDLTASELGKLRVGGTSQWIPTLDELLHLAEGQVPLVIELKQLPGRDLGFAFEVSERLRRYAGPAATMSFDPGLMTEMRVLDPTLPRGLIAAGDGRTAIRHLRTMLTLGVDFVSYAVDDLPTPMPFIARQVLNVPLLCWTVRTAAQVRKAKRWADQITFEGFRP